MVLATAGLNTSKLNLLCRERGLNGSRGKVSVRRQGAEDANEKRVLRLKVQKGLQKVQAQDQSEI